MRIYDNASFRPLIPDCELKRVSYTFTTRFVASGYRKERVYCKIRFAVDPAEGVVILG